MIKNIFLSILTATLLSATSQNDNSSTAERGKQFYEFEENNSSEQVTQNQTTKENSSSDISKTLHELLEVAKEQRDIQKKIYELLSEEFNPTPQKVMIDGKECIANSTADCFVMPLTNDAKKIPVLKEMLVNPTPETAKNYLQWQAKYLSTGPFKVGRSFQYAINTYGEEAYPMDIYRGEVNSNIDEIANKKAIYLQNFLNEMYENKSLGLFIFLSSKSLDEFATKEILEIIKAIKFKNGVTLVFKSDNEKKEFFNFKQIVKNETLLSEVQTLINPKTFLNNNIYMTPTYMAVSTTKASETSETSNKKQAVAIGRVSKNSLNTKIYEWLVSENIIKRGGMSDYKVWNNTQEGGM